MKEKSISSCELLARLTEVWNEVSTRVSVKLLNSRPCGVLCSYDHWGVGTCFLCLLIKTTTHSLVIGVDSFATFASNDRAGWQIGGGMECYTSTLFPALVSSFTQAELEMCTHISSFTASMAFKLQHLWRHHGKSNLNKHFISIEAAAGGGCGVCRERKAFVLSQCSSCEIHTAFTSVLTLGGHATAHQLSEHRMGSRLSFSCPSHWRRGKRHSAA